MSKLILVLAMITTMVGQSFSQSLSEVVKQANQASNIAFEAQQEANNIYKEARKKEDTKTKMNFVITSIYRMNRGFNTETNTLVPGNYTFANVEYTITVNDNTATIASVETITIPNSKEGLEQAVNQVKEEYELAVKESKQAKNSYKEKIEETKKTGEVAHKLLEATYKVNQTEDLIK